MNIQKPLTRQQAIQRAQYLCARQERCAYDIQQKLRQWQLSKDDIDAILENLISNKFIDDERFASLYVRDKSKFNKWGPIKIVHSLKAKHISSEIIEKLISEIKPDQDDKTLYELLVKKAKSTKSKSPYDLKVKLIRFGVSRGFDYSSVSDTVGSIIKEEH